MNEWIPESVAEAIGRHYRAAVRRAEDAYTSSMEDEDSVTGALGQAMTRKSGSVIVSGTRYQWRTTYRKFRGRGAGATEKQTGADGIFEIEVQDAAGDIIGRKAVLFQAKKEWQGRDRRLMSQSRRLSELPGAAIVVNYSRDGYKAASVEDVLEAEGDPPTLGSKRRSLIGRHARRPVRAMQDWPP